MPTLRATALTLFLLLALRTPETVSQAIPILSACVLAHRGGIFGQLQRILVNNFLLNKLPVPHFFVKEVSRDST